MQTDYLTDVVVIGSGSCAAVAALRAREAGFEVLVISEKQTAGEITLWLPTDEYQNARLYVDHALGDATVAQAARRHQFLVAAAQLPDWLGNYQIQLEPTRQADNYPDRPGGRESGRVWQMRRRGPSLTAQLFQACAAKEVGQWWNSSLTDLVEQDGEIVGVKVNRAQREVLVGANRAVVLTEGGFGSDIKLRREFVPGTRVAGSLRDDDAGRTIRLAREHSLELENMDQVWGVPGVVDPVSAEMIDATNILAAPHSFLIDETGKRFVAETAPYLHTCLDRTAWLIFDAKHRKSVAIGQLAPGRVPKRVRDSGRIVVADTLVGLAKTIHVDVVGLNGTADRFDEFCVQSRDEDFGRRVTKTRKNTSLGKVEQPPFYAIQVRQADYGTKGGLKVDEKGHTFKDGARLKKLFAAGTAAASMTSHHSTGPGMQLAEGMALAWSIFEP